jgi:hypothetical protein
MTSVTDRVLISGLLGRIAPDLASAPWEALVRAGRDAGLLGTLGCRLDAQHVLQSVPPAPRAHLIAARILSDAQHVAVKREIAEISRALDPLEIPIVALKGAAYVLADLPPSRGRMFSDIDILVPKEDLPRVESALMLAGYVTTHLDPYDQRYYRRWRHELPPMQHVKRLTVLDVHHNLVGRTNRIDLDPRALFRDAIPIPGSAHLHVLSPIDMVLHSATHLFLNESMTSALRDLVDIDALLRHFGGERGFWSAIARRAVELDVPRPLYYALRYACRLLDTPVPPHVQAALAAHAPPIPVRRLMDCVFEAALAPHASKRARRWARRALYVRGHWLKMPVPLLAWHLTVKAFRREEMPA